MAENAQPWWQPPSPCRPTSPGSTSWWEELRDWIEAETGMDFSGVRHPRLVEAAQKVMPAQGGPGPSLQLLRSPANSGPFLERLTAELTVGESFFFRNEHHFHALRDHVLPDILAARAAEREVRVWSAGCATGEEPYSVAILLEQLLHGQPHWRASILGTDLNPRFLDRAREGVYRPWSFRHTSIHTDRRYFHAEGEAVHLLPRVRDGVRFGYLNLVKDIYPSPLNGTLGLDLILFRNVAIYLRAEVTRAILERFYTALNPGGWLLLGEAEVTSVSPGAFDVERFEQATFFRKPRRAGGPDVSLPPPPVLSELALTPPASPGVSLLAGGGRQRRTEANPLPRPAPRLPSPAAQPKAGGVSPWDRIAPMVATGRLQEAECLLDRVSSGKERAALRLRYARVLLAHAEVQRARQMVDLCLREGPLQVEAQLLKASLAEEVGDVEGAERAYRSALYVDRTCPMAHFHHALFQQSRGDRAGAARSLRTVLRLTEGKDPQAPAEHGEGVCYGRLREMALLLCAR